MRKTKRFKERKKVKVMMRKDETGCFLMNKLPDYLLVFVLPNIKKQTNNNKQTEHNGFLSAAFI